MTRFELIQNLTLEEFSKFLYNISVFCPEEYSYECPHIDDSMKCEACLVNWLNSQVKDDKISLLNK